MHLPKPSRGFSLIELLVAISIIGIISAVGLTNYAQAQKVARDSKRKQDLASLAVAFELYYQQNKTHPPTTDVRDYNAGFDGCVSAILPTLIEPEFISKVPEDPLRQNYGGFTNSADDPCYWYLKGDPLNNEKKYTLFAKLENSPPPNDPNLCKPQQLYRANLSSYNYCLLSP